LAAEAAEVARPSARVAASRCLCMDNLPRL
jgi:hypothetical protein